MVGVVPEVLNGLVLVHKLQDVRGSEEHHGGAHEQNDEENDEQHSGHVFPVLENLLVQLLVLQAQLLVLQAQLFYLLDLLFNRLVQLVHILTLNPQLLYLVLYRRHCYRINRSMR